MSNYQESAVEGTKWVRASRVVVDNPYQGMPAIEFTEEQVLSVGGDVFKSHKGAVTVDFANPEKTFQLIHPVTGVVLGTVTHQDVQVILYSLYLDLAQARDASIEVLPPATPLP